MRHSLWGLILQPQDADWSPSAPRGPESPAESEHLLSCVRGLSSDGKDGAWEGQESLPGPQLQTPHLPGLKPGTDCPHQGRQEHSESRGHAHTHRASQVPEKPGWRLLCVRHRARRIPAQSGQRASGSANTCPNLTFLSVTLLNADFPAQTRACLEIIVQQIFVQPLSFNLLCNPTQEKNMCAVGTLSIKLGPKIQVVSH